MGGASQPLDLIDDATQGTERLYTSQGHDTSYQSRKLSSRVGSL